MAKRIASASCIAFWHVAATAQALPGMDLLLEPQTASSDSRSNSDKNVNEQPSDYSKQLNQRRISEYANPEQSLFGKSFDLTYSLSLDKALDFVFYNETVTHSIAMSTGLTDRLGLSAQTEAGNTSSSFSSNNEQINKTNNDSHALGLNYLLKPESPDWPRLVGSVGLSTSNRGEESSDSTRIGLNAARTLESSSLFASMSVAQISPNSSRDTYSRGVAVSYFLTVNHRLTAGLDYSLSKRNRGPIASSLGSSLIYSPFTNWLVRFSASETNDVENSRLFEISVTRTLNP